MLVLSAPPIRIELMLMGLESIVLPLHQGGAESTKWWAVLNRLPRINPSTSVSSGTKRAVFSVHAQASS